VDVCAFAYTLSLKTMEECSDGSKLRKLVPSSSTGDGGSSNLETKHEKKTSPRSKFFVSARRLH
jgi:hypothetical protein